jgi:hypothetical protein
MNLIYLVEEQLNRNHNLLIAGTLTVRQYVDLYTLTISLLSGKIDTEQEEMDRKYREFAMKYGLPIRANAG